MVGRNHHVVADALQALAGGGPAMYNGLGRLERNNLPTLKGGFNPNRAQNWKREAQKIFHVMAFPLEGGSWHLYVSGGS